MKHLPTLLLTLPLLLFACAPEPAQNDTPDPEIPNLNGGPDSDADSPDPDADHNADNHAEVEPRYPVLLIGMDGFKPEYLGEDYGSTPNFDRLIEAGVLAESLKPVFPTKTFPNLYSIVTGLYPENHGIISNTVYDPDRGETLRMFDADSQEQSHWWGGEPIWVTAEKAGLKASTFFWVGSEAEVGGYRPTNHVAYNSAIPHSNRVDQVLQWLTDDEDPTHFATLYFSRPDGAGHSHGPRSQQVANAVADMDAQLGRLIDGLEDAGIWPDINLLIVSDHGMVELDPDKVIFLDQIIDLQDVFVVDWTPVAMLSPRAGFADLIFHQLDEHQQWRDHYQVFRRDDLPEHYHLRHRRLPEIVMIADMPYTITSTQYFNSTGLMAASHGFDPEYPEMHGFFLAAGPDFRQDHRAPTLELVDLYELMVHLLGVDPADNDGSLERIGSQVLRDF